MSDPNGYPAPPTSIEKLPKAPKGPALGARRGGHDERLAAAERRTEQLEAENSQLRDYIRQIQTRPDPAQLVDLVLDHPWSADYPGSEHRAHQYDSGCAVCRGDVAAILALVTEPLLAAGRCQADNALNWHTTCIGCSGRMDNLYAERAAGFTEGLEHAARVVYYDYCGGEGNGIYERLVELIRSHLPHGKPIPGDDGNPF
jgi:hypothetical protein